MKRILLATAFLLSAPAFAWADEPQNEAKSKAVARALGTFSGTWEIVSVAPEGATKDARRLVFNPDGTYAATDHAGRELWAGTFEIDPTTTPKKWDHRSHEGQKKGADVLGIYEQDGDRLKVACVAGAWKEKEWTGKARPTGFDRKTVDVVIELKRVKAAK